MNQHSLIARRRPHVHRRRYLIRNRIHPQWIQVQSNAEWMRLAIASNCAIANANEQMHVPMAHRMFATCLHRSPISPIPPASLDIPVRNTSYLAHFPQNATDTTCALFCFRHLLFGYRAPAKTTRYSIPRRHNVTCDGYVTFLECAIGLR